jgi:uncharacterized protein
MMKPLRHLLLLPLLLWLGLAQATVAVPPLSTRVTDQTGTLDAKQRAALEQKLAAFDARKGAQIALLIVATTVPETIEQYSIRVVEQWKLGRKGIDDGMLVLVVRDDRALRIEVGYGLEGVVPDAIANRVIDEIIVPRFRAGDYYGGLDAGITRLIALVDGEPLPPPQAQQAQSSDDPISALLPLLFFGLFAAQGLRRLLGPGFGALAAGGGIFLVAWLLSGVLLMALLFGLVAAVLTLFGVHPGMIGGLSSRSGGGGGFGGGGGGFGGGGASGRW